MVRACGFDSDQAQVQGILSPATAIRHFQVKSGSIWLSKFLRGFRVKRGSSAVFEGPAGIYFPHGLVSATLGLKRFNPLTHYWEWGDFVCGDAIHTVLTSLKRLRMAPPQSVKRLIHIRLPLPGKLLQSQSLMR